MKHWLAIFVVVLLSNISVNAQIVASGSCGDNLTWTLSEQGELTIMGFGEMYNYLSLEETPWYDKRGSISRIFIKEGVTSIGDNAFAHCYLLRSITIPEGLTIIGTDAFADVNGLQTVFNYSSIKVVIGGSKPKILNINELVNIDKFLFYTEEGTHYLAGYIGEDTDIIFPSDYNGDSYLLNDYVFQHPDYITSITITKSIENISALTFGGCSNLTSIVVADENTKYDSREDCNAVIETSSNTLILGCSTTFIPNSVTSIDSYAFYECRNLTSIVIPKTIAEISNGAIFFGCNSLTSIVVEDGNTRYDSRNNCNAIIETNSNTLIAGCSTTIIPEDIESIGTNAFFGRGSLTSIEIPENVAVLGWWSFAFCDNLTSIVIPSSVTSLSNSVFWNCCSLSSITCHTSTPLNIDFYAFEGVDKSIPIYVPASSVDAYKAAAYWSEFTNILPIEEPTPDYVTITINQYGSGTYSSEHALDFNEVQGLKAYAAAGYDTETGVVTLLRVNTAKAGIGLFVKGTPGETYEVPIIESTSSNVLNMLVATSEQVSVGTRSNDGRYANYKYTILQGTSEPLFYCFKDGFSLGAGKAYLQIPVEWLPAKEEKARSIRLRFDNGDGTYDDEGTTEIDDAEFNIQNSELVYDLMGRRVTSPQKGGLYIVDGKKVIY